MSDITIILTIIGMGLVTYAVRISFILLFGKFKVPGFLERSLRYVPVAVLPALVAPALFYRNGELDISVGNERLLSGIVAVITVWYSRNILLTIGAGMVTLWILQSL